MKTNLRLACIFTFPVLLQGCVMPNNLFESDATSTSVTYHFDPEKYFKGKNRSDEMPFTMRNRNISALLFNTKEDLQDAKATGNKVNLTGAYDFNGGYFHFAWASKKKFFFLINASLYSKISDAEGYVEGVPATTTTTTTTTTWSWLWPNTTSSVVNTSQDIRRMPYQLTHRAEQNNIELAGGYYGFVGNYGIWEACAGVSNGTSTHKFTYSFGNKSEEISSNHYSAFFSETRNYNTFFIQNNFGYSADATEGAICARISYIHFQAPEYFSTYKTIQNEVKQNNVLFEPSVHYGIGGRHFKIFGEYGLAISLAESDVKWENGNFRLGGAIKF